MSHATVYCIKTEADVSESHVLEKQTSSYHPQLDWDRIFEQIKMDSAILSCTNLKKLSTDNLHPFHSDCWSELSKFIGTSDMNLKELAWVCQRRPQRLWGAGNYAISRDMGTHVSKLFSMIASAYVRLRHSIVEVRLLLGYQCLNVPRLHGTLTT